jgi:hypothetical protein
MTFQTVDRPCPTDSRFWGPRVSYQGYANFGLMVLSLLAWGASPWADRNGTQRGNYSSSRTAT